MPFPQPVPGLVLRYSYLWRAEQQQGQEEGLKHCPCAVVLVTTTDAGEAVVTVLPITHTPPVEAETEVEIPAATKNVSDWTPSAPGSSSRKPTVFSGRVRIFGPAKRVTPEA